MLRVGCHFLSQLNLSASSCVQRSRKEGGADANRSNKDKSRGQHATRISSGQSSLVSHPRPAFLLMPCNNCSCSTNVWDGRLTEAAWALNTKGCSLCTCSFLCNLNSAIKKNNSILVPVYIFDIPWTRSQHSSWEMKRMWSRKWDERLLAGTPQGGVARA